MTMLFRNSMRTFLRTSMVPTFRQPIKQIICMDIECTCDSPVQIHQMEVIELACVKLELSEDTTGVKNTYRRNTFHRYAKPVINPQLTLFCQELTGILQSTVDSANTIESVMNDLITWLKTIDLIDENLEKKTDFAFATCGNFDLRTLNNLPENPLPNLLGKSNDCSQNNELPIYFKEWINVKKTFVNHKKEWPKGLYNMLALLGETPSGRIHSAKDDCNNLARIIERLHLDGCEFYVTDRLKRN